MILMTWEGFTDRERLGEGHRKDRDRFSDMARDAKWTDLFGVLEHNPEWINLPRPGNRSGFTPLHQAAWHNTDFAVASRLIAHGAWRTQRNRAGQRAVDIARERGHTHLVPLLEPVPVRRLPHPQGLLQHHFHALLRETSGDLFHRTEYLLPPLAPLTETRCLTIHFPVFGMMGGFFYSLQENHVHVNRSSRMDADDGNHYRVTPGDWSEYCPVRRPRHDPGR